jgi:hypothetical protein
MMDAKTPTTEDAMALLEEYRAGQLADARDVACELIEHFGHTSARQVQEVMAARDLIDASLGNFWVGAIFRTPQFAWTGQWEFPPAETKIATKNKAHALRPIMVWGFNRLTNGGFAEQLWGDNKPRRSRRQSDVSQSTKVKLMRIRKRKI